MLCYGPAGTGKTETSKDLSKLLGYRAVVFNCSDELTVEDIARYIKSSLRSGNWLIFDEFNRIKPEGVKKFLTEEVGKVQKAIEGGKTTVEFAGEEVEISHNFNTLFLTLNPGRSSVCTIFDNFDYLNPFVLELPDYQKIIEVLLATYGFTDFAKKAEIAYRTFEFMKNAATKQTHYDFGLRAIKSAIATVSACRDEASFPQLILGFFSGSLTKRDFTMLQNFLSFLTRSWLEEPLKEDVKKNAEKLGIDVEISRKVTQFAQVARFRHGLFVLGKSAEKRKQVIDQSVKLLQSDERKIEVVDIEITEDNNQWVEGPVIDAFRKQAESENETWLVLRGALSAVTLENLNTVLDDNRVLCLVNGDRIPLKAGNHVVLDHDSADQFSPALVSRVGKVFVYE